MKNFFLIVSIVIAAAMPVTGQIKSYSDIKREQKTAAKELQRLEKAARAGDVSACVAVGDLYYSKGLDSKTWYQIGYDKGDALCAYRMATNYLNWPNSQEEFDSGIKILQIAVDRGSPEAMYLLGSYYHSGCKPDLSVVEKYRYSFEKDSVKSEALYRQAAAFVFRPALERLDLYELAAGDPTAAGYNAYQNTNYRLAYKLWIMSAIEDQDPVAMYNLGVMAANRNMPKDIEEFRSRLTQRSNDTGAARSWFEKAGAWGYAPGSYMAGEMWNLEGFRGNAIEWWEKAAKQGYQGAAERISKTQSDIAGEQEATARWVAQYNANYMQRARDNFYSGTSTKQTQTTISTSNTGTTTQRDQEMYDKMHQEANQREKWYSDKWEK